MELDIVDRQLKETEARFEAANQRIQDLEKQFNEAVQRKEQLAQEVDDCSKRLERAQTLMVSLGGEQVRWTQQLAATTEGMKNTLAKALFSAASLVYAGAFNAEYRATISQFLMERLRTYGFVIESSPGQIGEFKLTDILADQVTLMDYINRFKLPSDAHSQQNAVMLFNSQKYCLLIDPEGQGQ